MKMRIRPSRRAFFLVPARPSSANLGSAFHCVLVLAPPVAVGSNPDQPEFSKHDLRDSERQIPARSDEPPGDKSTAESHSRAAPDLRPGASLTALAASHSSAACGRRVPLGAARTSPGCDSRAPSGIRSVGPRGVDAQSPLVSVRVPIIVWLESGVSPRHQNREALQQGFPYLVRRSISEKGPLYYARFNRLSERRERWAWALLEAGDVCDERIHLVWRQLRRGHASGFHLGGRMAQELRDLVGRKFRACADQRGCSGRTDSAFAVTRRAVVRLENCLSFGGERIGQRHIRGGERSGRKLRLERLAHVRNFFRFLLGELLRDFGIAAVQIFAAQSQPYERAHYE